MLHLCYEDLRGMALQLLADYYGTKELPFRPLDPLDFAKNYMKLTVRYENLSYGIWQCLLWSLRLQISSDN